MPSIQLKFFKTYIIQFSWKLPFCAPALLDIHSIHTNTTDDVSILQEDGPLIVDNDYIAMERTASSDDDDNTVGIAVGVTIAVIVVIAIIIVGVVVLIWYYR